MTLTCRPRRQVLGRGLTVEALGWNWSGRIRNSIKYLNEATGRWCLTKSLYPKATTKVRHVGWVTLSKRMKYGFRLYLVRAYRVRRGRPIKRVRRKQNNLPMYHKMHKDPWLRGTNLPHSRLMPRQVKRLYAQRMQIEETFRDVKGHQWGMGLRYARCNSAKRLEVLLLLGALATLVLWISGLHARLEGVGRHFQANTLRSRTVLSLVFLGQQFLQRLRSSIPNDALDRAFFMLQILMRKAAMTLALSWGPLRKHAWLDSVLVAHVGHGGLVYEVARTTAAFWSAVNLRREFLDTWTPAPPLHGGR